MSGAAIGWLDCSAGASGDMFLGALADAGVSLDVMQAAVDALGTEPVLLTARRVTRHGLVATLVGVEAPEVATDRRWRSIRALIEGADLDEKVRELALGAFARLAAAEAAAHGIEVEDVHFHEVGALDSIADIVGAAAGLVSLGVERWTASTVTVGGGTTRGSHGSIPLPAPAVLRVLADAGAPAVGAVPYEACTPTGAAIVAAAAAGFGALPEMVVERIGAGAGGRDPKERANLLRIVVGRAVAPAGAAGAHHHHGGAAHQHDAPSGAPGHVPDPGGRGPVAASGTPGHGHDAAEAHGRAPDAGAHGHGPDAASGTAGHRHETAEVHGHGAGTGGHGHGAAAAGPAHGHGAGGHAPGPDAGEALRIGAPSGRPVVIETNVDDLDPRLWPASLAALLDAGASDAWLTPILMKKGRPAHTVHVLCRAEAVAAVRSALVRHTTTIGMRSYEIDKHALERRYTYVNVDGHEIGVKIALEGGEVVNASVEYEDAAAAAAALGRPLKVVMAQATALAAERY